MALPKRIATTITLTTNDIVSLLSHHNPRMRELQENATGMVMIVDPKKLSEYDDTEGKYIEEIKIRISTTVNLTPD